MKSVRNLLISFTGFAMLSFGASWNAKLVDANCANTNTGQKASQLEKKCAATSTTTSFAAVVNGKVYKLDTGGNDMTSKAWTSGSIKADHDGDVHATIQGTMQGDTIKVDSVNASKNK